jgi:uncharacterized membrane protein
LFLTHPNNTSWRAAEAKAEISKHIPLGERLMFIKACRNLRTIASAVAMLAATAAIAAQTGNADATTARQCLGTEPFWSLTLDGKTIKFEKI